MNPSDADVERIYQALLKATREAEEREKAYPRLRLVKPEPDDPVDPQSPMTPPIIPG